MIIENEKDIEFIRDHERLKIANELNCYANTLEQINCPYLLLSEIVDIKISEDDELIKLIKQDANCYRIIAERIVNQKISLKGLLNDK